MVRQMVQWMSTELKCSRKRQRKKAQDAINGGYVLNGLGATFEDTGITYTLQDVWYEKQRTICNKTTMN